MIVYGAQISYFTGKFETYLRYKGIEYEYRSLDSNLYRSKVPAELGATQYPSVELDDGRWMSDTTPMIAWLEERHPEPEVIPRDPVQRFFALLIEDYADEWLWRPAMHYRWSYAPDRYLAGTLLAEEIVRIPGAPRSLRRVGVARRQSKLFVRGDGIDARTREHAEGSYLRLLGWMEAILSERPFMLGERPTIADVGLMGPFWRHFVHDPTPAKLMQDRAPAVFEWTARMWDSRADELRVAAAPRRDPGRLGANPPRDRRDAPGGAGHKRGRLHRRREAPRPDRPGDDLPQHPDKRLPALVPQAVTGPIRRSTSRSIGGGPSAPKANGLLGTPDADARLPQHPRPRGATAPFCQATRMVRD